MDFSFEQFNNAWKDSLDKPKGYRKIIEFMRNLGMQPKIELYYPKNLHERGDNFNLFVFLENNICSFEWKSTMPEPTLICQTYPIKKIKKINLTRTGESRVLKIVFSEQEIIIFDSCRDCDIMWRDRLSEIIEEIYKKLTY